MSRALICYPDPQKRDLSVVLVDGLGKVFDPASGAFASNPSNARIALNKVQAADLSTYQVAVIPGLPSGSGPVVAFVLPAGSGGPVDEPIPVVTADDVTPYGVAFQV